MRVHRFLVQVCPIALIFFSAHMTYAQLNEVEASQDPHSTGFIGRRHVYRGMIMYLRTAYADSLQKVTFLADQAAFRAIAEECSFIPKGSKIYLRKSESGKLPGRFVASAFAEVEFEDCDHAKKIKNDPEKRKRFENDVVAKDQKLYEEYLRREILDAHPLVSPAQMSKVRERKQTVFNDDEDTWLDGPQRDPKTGKDVDDVTLDGDS